MMLGRVALLDLCLLLIFCCLLVCQRTTSHIAPYEEANLESELEKDLLLNQNRGGRPIRGWVHKTNVCLRNPRIDLPIQNQMIAYKFARIQHQWRCMQQAVENITGRYVKYIDSPGLVSNNTYQNNQLVYYNISCDNGSTIQLHFTVFELEEKLDGNCKNDYVCVCKNRNTCKRNCRKNSKKLCGHQNGSRVMNIDHNEVLIVFCTSFMNVDRGFSITAVCSDASTSSETTHCNKYHTRKSFQSTARLLVLYKAHMMKAQFLTAHHYRKMLRLATKCAISCDPVERAVGKQVLHLFPERLTKHIWQRIKQDTEGIDQTADNGFYTY